MTNIFRILLEKLDYLRSLYNIRTHHEYKNYGKKSRFFCLGNVTPNSGPLRPIAELVGNGRSNDHCASRFESSVDERPGYSIGHR